MLLIHLENQEAKAIPLSKPRFLMPYSTIHKSSRFLFDLLQEEVLEMCSSSKKKNDLEQTNIVGAHAKIKRIENVQIYERW